MRVESIQINQTVNEKELRKFAKSEFFDIKEERDSVYIEFLKWKFERYANSLDEREKEKLKEIIEELKQEIEEHFWIISDTGANLFWEVEDLILEKITNEKTREQVKELINELASNDEAYWYNRDYIGCIAWFEDETDEQAHKELLVTALEIMQEYYKAKIEEEYFIDTEEKRETAKVMLKAIKELLEEMKA